MRSSYKDSHGLNITLKLSNYSEVHYALYRFIETAYDIKTQDYHYS